MSYYKIVGFLKYSAAPCAMGWQFWKLFSYSSAGIFKTVITIHSNHTQASKVTYELTCKDQTKSQNYEVMHSKEPKSYYLIVSYMKSQFTVSS
jgi:hypothetical protein